MTKLLSEFSGIVNRWDVKEKEIIILPIFLFLLDS